MKTKGITGLRRTQYGVCVSLLLYPLKYSMEPSNCLLQAFGRAFLDRRRLGIRHFHKLRQATRHRRMHIDPYSQRMIKRLQAAGRGLLGRKACAARLHTQGGKLLLVKSLRQRKRLVPIGYRPPQSESERATRLGVLESLLYIRRVKAVQRWWRRVRVRRQLAHHQLVVARLAAFNAMAVLIQRWWRSILLQVRFVAPSSAELRESSLAIVTAQDLRLQRGDQRDKLLTRWRSIVAHDKAPRVGRVRP
jgi:hypothetical protein